MNVVSKLIYIDENHLISLKDIYMHVASLFKWGEVVNFRPSNVVWGVMKFQFMVLTNDVLTPLASLFLRMGGNFLYLLKP